MPNLLLILGKVNFKGNRAILYQNFYSAYNEHPINDKTDSLLSGDVALAIVF